MNRKYKDKGFRFDWFTVSYSTIIAWLLIIAVVIIVGFFIYLSYLKSPSPERKAERAIATAERLIAEIRELKPNQPFLTEEPLNPLLQAKRNKEEGDFAAALNNAEESQRLAQNVLDKIQQEKKGFQKAYLTSIEGSVQVKRKGTVDWIEGKERMALSSGDMVKTAANSTSHIMFFDGTSYILRASTLIAVHESYEDPFSRARKVLVKLDFGEVDLTTGKKNVPASTSAIASPTIQTTMGEDSKGIFSFNRDTAETSISIFKGTANLSAGEESIQIKSLEEVKINRNKEIASKRKVLPTPILLSPIHERQFLLKNPQESKFIFSWHGIEGAQSYNFEISHTSLFANPVLIRKGVKINRLELGGFDEGIYYWHVSAYALGKGESRFSNPHKFRIRKITKQIVSQDTTPPHLEVEKPIAFGNIFLIYGKTEPDALLTVNNKRADLESDGTFKDFIELYKVGKNELIIIAQDPSGNQTKVVKVVYIEEY